MGITSLDLFILSNLLHVFQPKSCLELGAQYLYDKQYDHWPVYAKEWFEAHKIIHVSVDINGEADYKFDLCEPLPETDHDGVGLRSGWFDLVTDFGTSEHVIDLYGVFFNIHNLCKEKGIMVHENPKTGNWPGHGFHYFSKKFYEDLMKAQPGYRMVGYEEIPAMNNITDGWNVLCVIQKSYNEPFMSRKKFESLPIFKT